MGRPLTIAPPLREDHEETRGFARRPQATRLLAVVYRLPLGPNIQREACHDQVGGNAVGRETLLGAAEDVSEDAAGGVGRHEPPPDFFSDDERVRGAAG